MLRRRERGDVTKAVHFPRHVDLGRERRGTNREEHELSAHAPHSPFRASALTLEVSREARAEGELPDGPEDANTATSSDPPATG